MGQLGIRISLRHPDADKCTCDQSLNRLFKKFALAAWGHAAYKFSSEIGMCCRPGALHRAALSTGCQVVVRPIPGQFHEWFQITSGGS